MIGREPQKENDLVFTCSLIDYIARVSDDFILEAKISEENFDNVGVAKYFKHFFVWSD